VHGLFLTKSHRNPPRSGVRQEVPGAQSRINHLPRQG
jgi:hypothetical protein